MAVGRRNGMLEGSDQEDENALFEDRGVHVEVETEIPSHLWELATATQIGVVDALRLAIDELNGSIDEPIEDGDTALHIACLYGHLPCVQLLLEQGANLEATDEDGAVPLHDACAGGFTEIVQLLLNCANGPECKKRMLASVDEEGDTPLHHAARGEHVVIIRLLLSSGASPTKRNTYEKTPNDLAEPESEARRVLEAAMGTESC